MPILLFFYFTRDFTYTVEFPDFEYAVVTVHRDYYKVLQEATRCLAERLYTLTICGEPYPPPTPLQKLYDSPCDESLGLRTHVVLVSVDVEKYAKTEYKKAVKKTVTIPRWMNDAAVARRLNFSRLLQRALLRELGVPNGEARKRRRERIKVWCGLGPTRARNLIRTCKKKGKK